jgi:hypothetical protein
LPLSFFNRYIAAVIFVSLGLMDSPFVMLLTKQAVLCPLAHERPALQVAMSSKCGLEAVDEVDEISSEGDVDSLMEQVAELAKVQKRLFDRFVKRAVAVT